VFGFFSEDREMMSESVRLENYIRSIADWPKEGILFRDITPLLADSQAFGAAVDTLCSDFVDSEVE